LNASIPRDVKVLEGSGGRGCCRASLARRTATGLSDESVLDWGKPVEAGEQRADRAGNEPAGREVAGRPHRQEKYAGINLKQANCMDTCRTYLSDGNDDCTGRSRVLLRSTIILRGRYHPLDDAHGWSLGSHRV